MYDEIGKKIKALARGTFIIEAIGAVTTGIVLMVSDADMIIIGLPIMIFGPYVAYVLTWPLYGFGELVDKTCNSEYYIGNIAYKFDAVKYIL